MRYITIALAKGRTAKKAIEILKRAGYDCSGIIEGSRRLIFTDERNKLKYILVKPADVPAYVEYGTACIGIVGKDVLLEEGRDLFEPLDLGFGKCFMVVAGLVGREYNTHYHLRVGTKFPNIASKFFLESGRDVKIIKLSGSVELSPVTGLSDVIVDLVETGATLRENGLEIKEVIAPISTRVVVNKAGMKMDNDRIIEIINRLDKAKKELGSIEGYKERQQ